MNFVRRFFIIITLLCLTTSCEEPPNVLADLASTDSDAAVYENARKKVDQRDWDSAITMITVNLSAGYQARGDVKDTLAGAYAGKCGLDFVNLLSQLSSSNNSRLFVFFMTAMKNKIVVPAACDSAAAVIESIGNSTVRTPDQNLFLAIVGMAKAGAWLRSVADQDNGGLGDGNMDAGFDPCDSAVAMPNLVVIKATMGLGLFINNIASISSQISGATVNDINAFKTNCLTALQVMDPTITSCDLTNQTLVTTYVSLFRSIINEGNSLGIGNCTTSPSQFLTCPCPP